MSLPAKCYIAGSGTQFDFDYTGKLESWNNKAKMRIGAMRITFTPDEPIKVYWREGKGTFQLSDSAAVWDSELLTSLCPAAAHIKKSGA